jgi:hypothetical protein
MTRALILGAAALVLSAASASAQVYTTPDYGYAEPVAGPDRSAGLDT